MHRSLVVASCLIVCATPAFAQRHVFINQPGTVSVPSDASGNLQVTAPVEEDEWKRDARLFVGLRTGVGVPPGGVGISPNMGAELGVAAPKGVGFGVHFFGTTNSAAVKLLDAPATDWAVGAELAMRFYFQTVEPLTLYPTFALGFLAGPAKVTRENVVLPILSPGFGARLRFGNVYAAFEFGLASFTVPFLNLGLGWEIDRPAPPPSPIVMRPVRPSPFPATPPPAPAPRPRPEPENDTIEESPYVE